MVSGFFVPVIVLRSKLWWWAKTRQIIIDLIKMLKRAYIRWWNTMQYMILIPCYSTFFKRKTIFIVKGMSIVSIIVLQIKSVWSILNNWFESANETYEDNFILFDNNWRKACIGHFYHKQPENLISRYSRTRNNFSGCFASQTVLNSTKGREYLCGHQAWPTLFKLEFSPWLPVSHML